MNIDAKIQEILLRSSPCNDNNVVKNIANPTNLYRSVSHISVVGNNNVIVTSGLLIYFLLGIVHTWIFLANQ